MVLCLFSDSLFRFISVSPVSWNLTTGHLPYALCLLKSAIRNVTFTSFRPLPLPMLVVQPLR
jgi:hypothetical protein